MTSTEIRRETRSLRGSQAQPRVADPLSEFHPAIQTWFRRRFREPTDAQAAGWPHIREAKDVLIAAPTGSGKTFAAFLVAIDKLIKEVQAPPVAESEPPAKSLTKVLYVSPLKALGNDIRRNLETPLAEIQEVANELGFEIPRIT